MFRWLNKPDCAALILRLAVGGILITTSYGMIAEHDWGTSWYVTEGQPMPAALQAAVAWGQLVCGAALLVGLLSRLAALAAMAIMLGAIYYVTWKVSLVAGPTADGARGGVVYDAGPLYNYAILAMCASLVILGGGLLSLDRLLWHRKRYQVMRPAEAGGPVPARV
jgi:putative oxidoreductase